MPSVLRDRCTGRSGYGGSWRIAGYSAESDVEVCIFLMACAAISFYLIGRREKLGKAVG